MWEPQPLATLRASAACTGITLPLPYWYEIFNIRLKILHTRELSNMFGLKWEDVTEA
jgi:hypothetical protein